MVQVVIVTPALAEANNGNWQTARRWQRFLAPVCPVRIVKQWPDAAADRDGVMLALHARRSAQAIAAWNKRNGSAGLGLVLTGTDLYRDIQNNPEAQRSLSLANILVVLQALGPPALPRDLRGRTRVIHQSTTSRQTLHKSRRWLRAVMVGHLREEKSPTTLFAAARLLADREDILLDHIGDALDPALGDQARATMQACPNYRWFGGLPHKDTRRRIQRAHLLLHTSRIEGGAHVIMEAVASGTPVLASAIAGNIGMLGEAYLGYFEWDDARALADLLLACRAGQSQATGLLARLAEQCDARAELFRPEAECRAVRQLVADLGAGHD
ncbi:MAG: selenoneine biosynthesis selenosugar synthase SenB [Proteobacteria bacterium]|nr:selenoneine biosynthesis selenosugar synthase SenB [Pseudomonadota bacterium]